jgi:DNA invertase Pin-like site-specific DNA recombinase
MNTAPEVKKIILESVSNIQKQEKPRLRVAAYCRVSTDMEEQQTSFEGQVNAYTEMIRTKPGWTLAGIYADPGISGTSVKKRPEFQRMLSDCENGKIDLIITKSISRFARNTLECLTYVRHLQSIGVDLIFESNHIDTRTTYSEMLLTVLAAFAQEESRSISENTKWGIRKRFENGTIRWCKIYGYTKEGDTSYLIVPKEAAVIQKIFTLYEEGSTLLEISKYLESQNIPSPSGCPAWSASAIMRLLKNEKYMGDILLQKFITKDHIGRKSIRNDCTEVPAYYIENHHAPIVSRKTFERVQKILELRSQGSCTGRKESKCIQYPFGTMLKCPHCGSTLYQRTLKLQVSGSGKGWCCEVGENACKNFIIRSEIVEKAVLQAYGQIREEGSPIYNRVDYYWVDEWIDHIEFGAHRMQSANYRENSEKEKVDSEDRVITVFWKSGQKTTVFSGIERERDMPSYLAGLYHIYLNQNEAYRKKAEAQTTYENHESTKKTRPS